MTRRSSNHDFGQSFSARFCRKNIMLLKQQEITLIELILQGKTNLEMAEFLGYSESSIKKMLTRLYKKFNVSTRIGLINIMLGQLKFETGRILRTNLIL